MQYNLRIASVIDVDYMMDNFTSVNINILAENLKIYLKKRSVRYIVWKFSLKIPFIRFLSSEIFGPGVLRRRLFAENILSTTASSLSLNFCLFQT